MKQSKGIAGLAKSVASCPAQATAYGQCIVASYKDVQQGMCQKEFEAFKSCVQQAVSVSFCTIGNVTDLFFTHFQFIFILDEEEMVEYCLHCSYRISSSNPRYSFLLLCHIVNHIQLPLIKHTICKYL